MDDINQNRHQQSSSHISSQYSPYASQLSIYTQWYNNLDSYTQTQNYSPSQYQLYLQQQYYQSYTHPQQYHQNYQYQYYYQNTARYAEYPSNNKIQKKQKLSRNQKRKQKLKKLKEQYEEQQKKIGKWVQLERKDLVSELKKLQQQQNQRKQKKKEKLSHLIEIHKEVYKHMVKKNKNNHASNSKKNHILGRRKKKISHIKKMKQLYEQFKTKGQGEFRGKIYFCKDISSNNKIQINGSYKTEEDPIKQAQIKQQKQVQNSDNDYVTDSENQDQAEIGVQKKEEKEQKQIKFVEKINYEFTGKLNGRIYNNIVLREWVDHSPSAELEDQVLRLINRLAYKQAINKVNKPQKYKKLVVGGVHECRRTLVTTLDKKKCKLLVLALNIQKNELSRGIDDQIQELLGYAKKQKILVIHISTRNKLGRAFTGKFGPRFTMLSIINYQGYQDMMDQIIKTYQKQKNEYERIL